MVSYIEENYATKVLTEKIRIFACFMSEFISRRRRLPWLISFSKL